jgi:hypothetical protein
MDGVINPDPPNPLKKGEPEQSKAHSILFLLLLVPLFKGDLGGSGADTTTRQLLKHSPIPNPHAKTDRFF